MNEKNVIDFKKREVTFTQASRVNDLLYPVGAKLVVDERVAIILDGFGAIEKESAPVQAPVNTTKEMENGTSKSSSNGGVGKSGANDVGTVRRRPKG